MGSRLPRGLPESFTPYGQPFTGRQFANNEVYLSAYKQNELRHGDVKSRGSFTMCACGTTALGDATTLRKTYPRGASGATFSGMMETLRGGFEHGCRATNCPTARAAGGGEDFELLGGVTNVRLEASGVLAKDWFFYLIFDNIPHIGHIGGGLSRAARQSPHMAGT